MIPPYCRDDDDDDDDDEQCLNVPPERSVVLVAFLSESFHRRPVRYPV